MVQPCADGVRVRVFELFVELQCALVMALGVPVAVLHREHVPERVVGFGFEERFACPPAVVHCRT